MTLVVITNIFFPCSIPLFIVSVNALRHEDKKDYTSGDFRLCVISAAYTQNMNPGPCQRGFGLVYCVVSHVGMPRPCFEEISHGHGYICQSRYSFVHLHRHKQQLDRLCVTN